MAKFNVGDRIVSPAGHEVEIIGVNGGTYTLRFEKDGDSKFHINYIDRESTLISRKKEAREFTYRFVVGNFVGIPFTTTLEQAKAMLEAVNQHAGNVILVTEVPNV